MDKISELLQFVQRTNPSMTKEKLIKELVERSYSGFALGIVAGNYKGAGA